MSLVLLFSLILQSALPASWTHMQEVHDLKRVESTDIINFSYSSTFPKNLIGLIFGSHLPSRHYLSFGSYSTILLGFLSILSSFFLSSSLTAWEHGPSCSHRDTASLDIQSLTSCLWVYHLPELISIVPATLAVLAPGLDFQHAR